VLSCGASIHRRARASMRQVVLTVCAGPPAGALTPFAAEHHRRWGAPPGGEADAATAMVLRRRAEDDAALALLGAEAARLAVPDAIYRRLPDGRAPYRGLDALFGPVAPGEAGLVAELAAALAEAAADVGVRAGTRVWIPLGAGGHVDHRLTRAAAEAWLGAEPTRRPARAYYEDLPYAAAASPAAIAALAPGLRRLAARVGADDLAAKVAAVACYASQISTFWPDAAAMETDVRAWSAKGGADNGSPLAERGWLPARRDERASPGFEPGGARDARRR